MVLYSNSLVGAFPEAYSSLSQLQQMELYIKTMVVSLPEDMLLEETSVLAKPVIALQLPEPEPAAISEICLRFARCVVFCCADRERLEVFPRCFRGGFEVPRECAAAFAGDLTQYFNGNR